jgi:hypothetical protein
LNCTCSLNYNCYEYSWYIHVVNLKRRSTEPGGGINRNLRGERRYQRMGLSAERAKKILKSMVNAVGCVLNPSRCNFNARRDGYEKHRFGIPAARRARTLGLGGTHSEQLARRPRAGSSRRKPSPVGFVRLRVSRRPDIERRLGAFGTRFGPKYALRDLRAPLCGGRTVS